MPTFEFTFSESFLVEMFRQYRRSRKLARYVTLFKVVLGLCLVGVIAVCLFARTFPGACVISLFLALLVFSPRIDEWLVTKRFRKSPYHNERVRIQLSPDGLLVQCTKSTSQLGWTVFTGARRFEEGFLLFQGPGAFNWLPVNSMTEGTLEQAEELIRANVSDYKSS